MSKKKHMKNKVAYVKFGNNKVTIKDLTDQVNEMDKKFGIRLKHPDVWSEPEKYKEVICAKIEHNICRLLCIVNGIDEKEYLGSTDSVCIGMGYQEFTDLSYLDWYDDDTCYNTESLMFRCRFISFVLEKMIGKVNQITEREVKARFNVRHSVAENQILIMKDFYRDVIRFVLLMINTGNTYQNCILKITEHVTYGNKRFPYVELQSLLNSHILTLRKGMEKDVLSNSKFFEDDMSIFNILKISYMLSTGKTNLDCLPGFMYIENATVRHDLIKLIEALGIEVVKARKMTKMTPMFTAFMVSKPLVYTQYNEEINKNFALKMGFMALAYTKFVMNDKTINKFIDEMMKKGI